MNAYDTAQQMAIYIQSISNMQAVVSPLSTERDDIVDECDEATETATYGENPSEALANLAERTDDVNESRRIERLRVLAMVGETATTMVAHLESELGRIVASLDEDEREAVIKVASQHYTTTPEGVVASEDIGNPYAAINNMLVD